MAAALGSESHAVTEGMVRWCVYHSAVGCEKDIAVAGVWVGDKMACRGLHAMVGCSCLDHEH